MKFEILQDGTLSFDASCYAESGCDYLTIRKNGNAITNGSTFNTYNSTSVTNFQIDVENGDEITFSYRKDGSVNDGYDDARISNVVFTPTESAVSDFEVVLAANGTSYPWIESSGIYTSGNQGQHGTTSTMKIVVNANGTLSFKAYSNGEQGCDYLVIRRNNNIVNDGSFSTTSSTTLRSFQVSVYEGDEITFTYSKDGSVNSGYDQACVTAVSFS